MNINDLVIVEDKMGRIIDKDYVLGLVKVTINNSSKWYPEREVRSTR